MARIFDVIEHTNPMRNEMVHRIPERGSGDFRIGSQLIVRESQAAVFVRDGQALDTFHAGRHTITTANVPLLADLVGKAFGGRTPFTAEVYFVSQREFLNLGWGTKRPILARDPEFGAAALRGFGKYSIQISNPQMFIAKIMGARASYSTNEIQDMLRGVIVEKVRDVVGEAKLSVLDLAGMTEEIRAAARAKASEMFEQWGVTLKSMLITSLEPVENQLEVLAEMGVVSADRVRGLQAVRTADATLAAAQQPGGGIAGMGAGLGAGMAIAQQMTQSMMGAAQQPAQPAAPTAPVGGKVPNIMTPAQAAAYLQVAEADIMAMINDGSLKAKKLGSTYRIAKAVIDEFMAG